MIDRTTIIQGAQDLLNSVAFDAALKHLEDNYTAQWRASTLPQAPTREDAWCMIRAIGELREAIRAIAAENRVAEYSQRLKALRSA